MRPMPRSIPQRPLNESVAATIAEAGFGSKTADVPKDYTGEHQKDWIVMDPEKGCLFCIAIASKDGKTWKLVEYVMMEDLEPVRFWEAVNKGFDGMLKAAKGQKSYEYVIAKYRFEKGDVIHQQYWRDLITGRLGKEGEEKANAAASEVGSSSDSTMTAPEYVDLYSTKYISPKDAEIPDIDDFNKVMAKLVPEEHIIHKN